MIITDRIYGTYKISSPVIIELINSYPVQRLKNISQMGPPNKYYHLKGYSRYEHSLGVMLLLKYLKATEEEQIAGLLHDISHTAFSHLIDWIVGSGATEEFQDNQHEKYFLNSEIKKILLKYKYNPLKVSNNKNYTLLENNIPNICADRFDYSAREFPIKIAKTCFQNLTNYNNKMVFKNKKSALLFATNFLERQQNHWGGLEGTTRYVLFAQALKLALNDKLIIFADFMKDENYIVKKLESSPNKKIKLILSILKKKNLSHLPKSKESYHKKFRYVDPQFLKKDKLFRLSDVDNKFKQLLESAKKQNKKGIKIGKISY